MPFTPSDKTMEIIQGFISIWEFLGIIGATFLALIAGIKKSRLWVINLFKTLYSKWPYEIIRKQREEIARLKGEKLSDKENITLQCLWAYGTSFSLSHDYLMKILKIKSQEAAYILGRLKRLDLIIERLEIIDYAYYLSYDGRKYITDHNLGISKDDFMQRMGLKK